MEAGLNSNTISSVSVATAGSSISTRIYPLVVSFAAGVALVVVTDEVDFWVAGADVAADVAAGCGAEESFWQADKSIAAPIKTVKIFFFIFCSFIISNPANRGQTVL